MKKTPLKQIGKIGKINAKANKKIAEMFMNHDIHYCEVCPVLYEIGLLNWQCIQSSSNAHRYSRHEYRSNPELLWDYQHVVKACHNAHTFIDKNTDVREEVFIILRGAI